MSLYRKFSFCKSEDTAHFCVITSKSAIILPPIHLDAGRTRQMEICKSSNTTTSFLSDMTDIEKIRLTSLATCAG